MYPYCSTLRESLTFFITLGPTVARIRGPGLKEGLPCQNLWVAAEPLLGHNEPRYLGLLNERELSIVNNNHGVV